MAYTFAVSIWRKKSKRIGQSVDNTQDEEVFAFDKDGDLTVDNAQAGEVLAVDKDGDLAFDNAQAEEVFDAGQRFGQGFGTSFSNCKN